MKDYLQARLRHIEPRTVVLGGLVLGVFMVLGRRLMESALDFQVRSVSVATPMRVLLQSVLIVLAISASQFSPNGALTLGRALRVWVLMVLVVAVGLFAGLIGKGRAPDLLLLLLGALGASLWLYARKRRAVAA